jgi:hypothetical protein
VPNSKVSKNAPDTPTGEQVGNVYALCPFMMLLGHLVQSHRVKISLLRWLICGAMLIALPALQAAYVPLAWSPSADPNVTGYKIYYGVASGG